MAGKGRGSTVGSKSRQEADKRKKARKNNLEKINYQELSIFEKTPL
jgi:hypothetical protein